MVSTSHVISGFYDSVLALVYPQACAVCDASVESHFDGAACETCWAASHLFNGSETLCWKCGAHSPASVAEDQRQNIRCGKCDDYAFTSARACGPYEGALRASILALKRDPQISQRLANVMRQAQSRTPIAGADLIISGTASCGTRTRTRF